MEIENEFNYEDVELTASDDDIRKVAALGQEQVNLENEIADLETKLKEMNSKLENISRELLPDKMIELGMQEFTLTDGSKIKVADKFFGSIKKAHEPEAFTWLRANGNADYIKNSIKANLQMGEDDLVKLIDEFMTKNKVDCEIKPTIHPSTLKSFIRKELKKGTNLPDCFSIIEFKETKITKQKG